jgi:hypothetical protein
MLMADEDRKELIDRIVGKALQAWRSRPRNRRPSSHAVAHGMVHRLFEDVPKGAFKPVKPDEKDKS